MTPRGPRRRGASPPPADARAVALDVLLRVEAEDAFADVLLAQRLAEARLAPADQALATRLVYGVLAWQGRLDHHLAGLVSRPLRKLDAPVRAALRLGLLQLLFLDRVPAFAAVDTSVRLARRCGPGAAGVVNAVLRRAATLGRAGLPLPDGGDPIARLAVEWSHPRWLVERWATEAGLDALPAVLAANQEAGAVAVRANGLRTTPDALAAALAADGVTTTPGRFAPDALVLEGSGAPLRGSAAWQAGDFAFQGEASQLVARLVAPAPGATVLDACAAPGGKSTYLAALGAGRVVALDPHAGGAARIAAEAARLHASAVHAVVADARRPPLRAAFDAVLVDAPCTGLGTLRRHPEARWRRTPDDVIRLATLQREILHAVAPLVRPGGTLVYAVCTTTHEEGPDVVQSLLDASDRFTLDDAATYVPPALVTSEGHLRTSPHRDGLDGFFAARLRARDD